MAGWLVVNTICQSQALLHHVYSWTTPCVTIICPCCCCYLGGLAGWLVVNTIIMTVASSLASYVYNSWDTPCVTIICPCCMFVLVFFGGIGWTWWSIAICQSQTGCFLSGSDHSLCDKYLSMLWVFLGGGLAGWLVVNTIIKTVASSLAACLYSWTTPCVTIICPCCCCFFWGDWLVHGGQYNMPVANWVASYVWFGPLPVCDNYLSMLLLLFGGDWLVHGGQ